MIKVLKYEAASIFKRETTDQYFFLGALS